MKYYLVLFNIIFVFSLAGCDESQTPTSISNEKRIQESCITACKGVGREMKDAHAFGVGCTCK